MALCTELLCPATADEGDCSRNLGRFLCLDTYIIWALHGSCGLHVSFFSPKTRKDQWKHYMKNLRRIQRALTLIVPRTLSCSNNHLPFCIPFPILAVFSGKGGVGVRAEEGSCKAEGIGGRKKHHPQVASGLGCLHQSRGCYGPTSAAVRGCLWAPGCCVGRGCVWNQRVIFSLQ